MHGTLTMVHRHLQPGAHTRCPVTSRHSLVAQQRLAAGAAAVELLCRVKLAADDARDAAGTHEYRQR